jgi:hypothetical protein
MIAAGATEMDAADACILAPLSNDGAITDGLREIAAACLLGSRPSASLDMNKHRASGGKP